MAIIIVLVLLWWSGPGDGSGVVVVVAAAALREALVEYPIAPPVVAVAATEVSDTRGDIVGVAARLGLGR